MEAAGKLHLCARRIKQLKKAFREQGENAVIHGNSGKHPANYTDENLRKKIIALKKTAIYSETNFTHFMELLAEREDIKISYTTLSNILINAGITSKRKHRPEGKSFKRRERRAAFGDLLQADATPYDWFDCGEYCALHAFIDDATGNITGLYFCQNECLMGYLEVLRQTLTNFGIPNELYADKAGIFVVNNKNEDNWTIEEMLAGKPLDKTQFGSIIEEHLRITMISANTPQAKGRIERLWNTLQDRLRIWLKLEGITSMEHANRELHRYITIFNNRFAVQPKSAVSVFEPLNNSIDLDKLLTVRYERVTDNCGCFSFQNFIFQIDSKKTLVKKKIKFLFSEKIGFLALYNKEYYSVSCLGLKNKNCITRIPDVVKILMQKNYYVDGKHIKAA